MMLSGDYVVTEGLINEEQLRLALDKQRERRRGDAIAKVLVGMGELAERDRVRCLGKVWGVPYLDLGDCVPNPAALALLSPQLAKKFRAVPIQHGSKLTVAMANPLDVFVIDELSA